MFRIWVLIFVFFSYGFGRVDVVFPKNTQNYRVIHITACGTRIAYIFNHRGRTKVVPANKMTQRTFDLILRYIKKTPVINGKHRVKGVNIPCHRQQRDISV